MFDYADALVRYASEQGWQEQLNELFAADIKEALAAPEYAEGVGIYQYLESRLKTCIVEPETANA